MKNPQAGMLDAQRWRSEARTVAYLDLMWAKFLLMFSLPFYLLSWIITIGLLKPEIYADEIFYDMLKGYVEKNARFLNPDELATLLLWRLWTTVFAVGIFAVMELWAARELMRATEIDQKPKEILRLCKSWRNLSILLCLIVIIANMFIPKPPNDVLRGILNSFTLMVMPLLIRVLFLFIVNRFTTKLVRVRDKAKAKAKMGKDVAKLIILHY